MQRWSFRHPRGKDEVGNSEGGGREREEGEGGEREREREREGGGESGRSLTVGAHSRRFSSVCRAVSESLLWMRLRLR